MTGRRVYHCFDIHSFVQCTSRLTLCLSVSLSFFLSLLSDICQFSATNAISMGPDKVGKKTETCAVIVQLRDAYAQMKPIKDKAALAQMFEEEFPVSWCLFSGANFQLLRLSTSLKSWQFVDSIYTACFVSP